MRILADENISPMIVSALQADGHDVISASRLWPGSPDTHLIAMAKAGGRIMLTEDKDFGALAFGHGQVPPGLVRLALHGFDPAAKAARLLAVLQAGETCYGMSVVIEPRQVRRRALP